MPWHRIAAPCEMMVNSSGLDGRSNRKDRFSFCVPRDEIWKGDSCRRRPSPRDEACRSGSAARDCSCRSFGIPDERCWLAQFGISRRERKFVRSFCSYPCQTTVAQCPKFNIATKLCSPIGTQLVSS